MVTWDDVLTCKKKKKGKEQGRAGIISTSISTVTSISAYSLKIQNSAHAEADTEQQRWTNTLYELQTDNLPSLYWESCVDLALVTFLDFFLPSC